jgi:hypothetical protein
MRDRFSEHFISVVGGKNKIIMFVLVDNASSCYGAEWNRVSYIAQNIIVIGRKEKRKKCFWVVLTVVRQS